MVSESLIPKKLNAMVHDALFLQAALMNTMMFAGDFSLQRKINYVYTHGPLQLFDVIEKDIKRGEDHEQR
jgi:hypothetical protein